MSASMEREAVNDSWFGNRRRNSWKVAAENDKAALGVLAFGVVNLMSKVVNLWRCLSDEEIRRLKEEVLTSTGIRRLVSEHEDHLMDHVLNEIMENVGQISRSVAILSRNCMDPFFRSFEDFVDDPIGKNHEWEGWTFRSKKMEAKVKKMESFVMVMMQLSQKMEVLRELEQTLQRLQATASLDQGKHFEFQQKVLWQRREVKNIRKMSPWIRTYDYVVRLLARSVLTILKRVKCVFMRKEKPICPYSSSSALSPASIHPLECIPHGSASKMGEVFEKSKTTSKRLQQQHSHLPPTLGGSHPNLGSKRWSQIGPFRECMAIGGDSPIVQSHRPSLGSSGRIVTEYEAIDNAETQSVEYVSCSHRVFLKLALSNSKPGIMLTAPPSTLGDSALALQYANVILLVEKLSLSPQSINRESRDALYNMLTKNIKTALRARLKVHPEPPSLYDVSAATKLSLGLKRTLQWLCPLARNMIRWQSERNFERDREVSGKNVLLVHTLYYADQAKTEAAITDLLVGLNYICRIERRLKKNNLIPDFSGC